MSRYPLIEDDDLLPVIQKATNDQLDPLVDYITKKGFFTMLDGESWFKANYPNHQAYANELAAELQRFGGNSFANAARGGKGVSYRVIVQDVADKLKVNYNKSADVAAIEQQILLKMLEDSYQRMTPEERKELLATLGIKHATKLPAQLPVAAIQAAIRLGGFTAYRIALIIANSIAKFLLGRGLRLATNATLARALSVLSGPVGWGINAVWTALDLAGPAYRVTIPCVIQIALIRLEQSVVRCGNGHENAPGAQFCSGCGERLD